MFRLPRVDTGQQTPVGPIHESPLQDVKNRQIDQIPVAKLHYLPMLRMDDSSMPRSR
ncbi:hypothetical protein THTE_0472 [Thermogutta terrifontis]|uniref:Uncharacterized protein n=1 Tax=Thermogutta terrifontis TaxID=1331910 RepID=A0A286RAS7_9BACT|nr:hypothetical protein THTE_0472 [Thermogutta terrifontis]